MNYKVERITKLIACDDEFSVGENVRVKVRNKTLEGTIRGIGDRYLSVSQNQESVMINYSDIEEITRT